MSHPAEPPPSHHRDNTPSSSFHDPAPPTHSLAPSAGSTSAADQKRGPPRQANPVNLATSSTLTAPPMSTRTRSKAYQSGIAAGAEDAKYATKYRDLKVKVREIEAENDRLLFKLKQAKRNIQRAKIERAILYERLSNLPASPLVPNANLPPPPPPPSAGAPRVAPAPSRHAPPPPTQHQPAYNSRRHDPQSGPPYVPTHHQPIAPAPATSPPSAHPPPPGRSGALPLTHNQEAVTVITPDGPLAVVAGPDGQPVLTPDGLLIPIDPPVPLAPTRRRGRGRGRVAADAEIIHEHALHVEVPEPHSAGAHPGQQRAPYWMDDTRRRTWEREQETGGPPPSSARHYRHHDYDRERGPQTHEHSVGGSPPPSASVPMNSAQVSPIEGHPQAMRSSHHYPTHRHTHGHSHGHHSQHSHSHSQSHSGSPHSPTGPHAAASYPSQRMHHHQRIGPGSNVIRERERRDREAVDSADVPMAVEDNRSDGQAPVSRVPTPPYMRRSVQSRDAAEQGALDRDRASQGPPEVYAAPPTSEHARSRSNSHTPN